MDATVPRTEPQRLAADTFLITNLAPVGPEVFLPVNSVVIAGPEPVIVDTGAPIHRDHWFEQVCSLVDLEDVRWIFLSHDDGDHMGNLHELLERCPAATLVANFFITERLALERPLPLERMVWLEGGGTFRAGDRTLRLVVPPIFDGVTTRGLYDESTGLLWAVDSFAALTPGPIHHVDDLPVDLYDETFQQLNSLISPWHQWLDPAAYRRHVDGVATLELDTVASAHGPILSGAAIEDALERVAALAGRPRIPPPGQELLDELVAAAISAPVPAAPAPSPI